MRRTQASRQYSAALRTAASRAVRCDLNKKNNMVNYEIGQIRNFTLELFPGVDFDSSFTFFYDETNNPRKVYVQENDLNTSFTSNFVLGGVVFCNKRPNDLSA